MIDLSPYQLDIVINILKNHVPKCEVRAFGSRYKWTAKDYSDLDLVVVGNKKLDKKIIYDLQESFSESELPIRVDVLDWHAISDEFKQIINQGYEVIQKKTIQLPDDWEVKKILEVGKIITDKAPSCKNPEYWGSIMDFITPSYYNNNKKLGNVARKLSQFGINALSKNIIPKNNVMITCIGSDMGKIAINSNDCLTNQQINSIVINLNLADVDFIYYLMCYNYNKLRNLASGGTTMPIINKTTFENIKINLPPLATQNQIASILSVIDEKININNQINKKLEEIAQAVFKQWFVDFNFPDENGTPYKDSGGSMIDSELGKIPKDWSANKITNIINRENISYKCDKKDLHNNGNTCIIDQGKNGLYGFTNRAPDFIATYENPVIVFTNHTCNFWFVDYPFCAIQNILPFRGRCGYDEYFIYYLTKGSMKCTEYKGYWRNFVAKNFIIPNTMMANKFSQIAKIILNQISQMNKEIKILQQILDTLLPKLMSGEIDVNSNRHCEEQSSVAISQK